MKPSSHGDQIGQFDLCFECSETAKTRHGWTQVLFVETGCIFTICNNEFSKVCGLEFYEFCLYGSNAEI